MKHKSMPSAAVESSDGSSCRRCTLVERRLSMVRVALSTSPTLMSTAQPRRSPTAKRSKYAVISAVVHAAWIPTSRYVAMPSLESAMRALAIWFGL